MELYYFQITSMQNKSIEWQAGKEITSHPQFVTIDTTKCWETNISYEDIRAKRKNSLA